MNPITNGKIIRDNCPFSVYEKSTSERGKPDYIMSRGDLVEFSRCPIRWRMGYEAPETKPKEWGALMDCLVTTPDSFAQGYAVKPETYTNDKGEVKPWNGNANVCKDWLANQVGKEIVSHQDKTNADAALARLMADQPIADLIRCSRKQVFVTGEYHDQDTGLVIAVKGLVDLVPNSGHSEYGKCLADLKTAQTGSPRAYQRHVFDYGLHVQAAIYLDLWTAATGEDRCEFRHIVQESFPPWQPGRRIISAEFVELGRSIYQESLRNYATALKTNTWNDYETGDRTINGWSLTEPEPWMLKPV